MSRKKMKKEIQKYYEDRFAMMATQGWKDFIEDVETMLVATDNLGGISTVEQLHFRKGEVSVMNWIKNLRDASGEVYERLQEEDDDAS
jgi:predicted translin family RNA/ssDNA-binding protein